MDLWHLNNMKVIWTLWTLNYVDCIPSSCIESFHIVNDRANWFKKVLFLNLQKHDQTSINLADVFDFIG